MNKKDLKKLSRLDLLELLFEQSKEIDNLKAELEETKNQLNQKEIMISDAGSIADAVLKLNDIFSIAQETANQYVNSVKKVYQNNNVVETRIKKETNEYVFSLIDDTNCINNQESIENDNETNFDNAIFAQSLKTFDYDLKDSEITNWDWDV